ncbi:Rv3235 family protein [Streptomyces sp. NPDC087294]|uniref:Rv3235 family protein n=1 Tax=Streptomyces sp. NPDC087294 TaxID=3365777 RepID=UPI0037FFAD2F
MHKVMTRAQQRTSTRPPTRGDSRRPSGTPPRAPGGTRTRTAPSGDGPSNTPGALRPTTGPTDNRPATAATARPTTPDPAQRTRQGLARTGPSTTPSAASPTPTTAAHASSATAAAPTVPAQSRRRLPVPQQRPTDLFADRLLEVLSGRRPVHWMLRHTAGRAYDQLTLLAERAPLRTRGPLPVVRDIGYYVPRPGAIEAFARIGAGDRVRALAFRLEQGPDLRWRCTAVEAGGPPGATRG